MGSRELHIVRHLTNRLRHPPFGDGLRLGGVDVFPIGGGRLSLVVALHIGWRVTGCIRLRKCICDCQGCQTGPESRVKN